MCVFKSNLASQSFIGSSFPLRNLVSLPPSRADLCGSRKFVDSASELSPPSDQPAAQGPTAHREGGATTMSFRSLRPHMVDKTQCSLTEATRLIQHHGSGNPKTNVVFCDPDRTFQFNDRNLSRISVPVLFSPTRSSNAAQTQSATNQPHSAVCTPTLLVHSDTSLAHRPFGPDLGSLPGPYAAFGTCLTQKRARRCRRA